MLVHSEKSFFSLQFLQGQIMLGHSFQRGAYWFVFKATRVFPIPTQEEQTENGEHFFLMVNMNPICKGQFREEIFVVYSF